VARRALVAALAASLALAACGGDDSSDDDGAPARPQPLLGVTTGAVLDEGAPLAAEVRAMAASGVTSLRAPFYWHHAQPEQDGALSFDATDRLVAATARARIELLPIVVGTPAWAAKHPELRNSPPAGTDAFAAFLEALIDRYGPDGSFWADHPGVPKQPIRAWQLWNEPDHLHYWSDQPYQRGYVRLARAARTAIKAADPGAKVVMAGFADRSWDSIAAVYRAGGKGVFDVVAIHPYTFEVRDVLRIVEFARRELREAGDGDRPLWLTEVTWSSGKRPGVPARPFETTPSDQAARLAQALPLLIRERDRLGIGRIYWENWISTDRDHGNPFNFSGLRVLGPDGSVSEKPAFAEFKRIALAQRGD
jgi:ABC-type glycerol-3-phosphate transport system substrate-binding protein